MTTLTEQFNTLWQSVTDVSSALQTQLNAVKGDMKKINDDAIKFDSIRIQRYKNVRGQTNFNKKFLFSGMFVVVQNLNGRKFSENSSYKDSNEINSYKNGTKKTYKSVINVEIDADTLEFKYTKPINYNDLIGIDLLNNRSDINISYNAAKFKDSNGRRNKDHPMKWVNGCTIQLLNGTNVIYETRIIDTLRSGATNYPIYPSAISTPKYTYNGLTDYAQYKAFLISGPKYKGSSLENMINKRNNLGGRQRTYQQDTQQLFFMKDHLARVDREHMRSHWIVENSRKNKALNDLAAKTAELKKVKAELNQADALANAADSTELETAKASLATKTSELSTANSSLASKTSELATANANLETKTNELATANANLETKTNELATANASLATANANLETKTNELATANENLPRITASYANDTGKLTVNYRNVKSSKHFWGIYNNNDNPFDGNNGKYKGWGEISKKPVWGYLNGTHVAPIGDFETTGSFTLHHPNLPLGSYKVVVWNNVGTPNNENRNIMHGQDPNVASFTKSSQPTVALPAGIPAGFREAFTDSKFVEGVNTTSDGKIYVKISLHDGQDDTVGFLVTALPAFSGKPFDKFAQKIKEHGGRTINNLGDLYDEFSTGKWAIRFNNKSYHIDREGEINDYQNHRAQKSAYLILKCKGTYTNDWYLESSVTRAVDITWYTSHQ